ncbi:hypothetical protein LTS18_014085, partial [Coniosporium uncinatum]
ITITFYLLATIIETLHLPLHILLFTTHRLHLVTALVLAILFLALWVWQTLYYLLSVTSLEFKVTAAWLGLSYAASAAALLVLVLYLTYLGLASAAVHDWRKERKGRREWKRGSREIKGDVELEEEGRRGGGFVDARASIRGHEV